MKLPRVTLDDFLKFEPGWPDDERGLRRLEYCARKLGGSANALEILASRMIPAEDRLWAVLREEFIPAPILHACACRCAEDLLSRSRSPHGGRGLKSTLLHTLPGKIVSIPARMEWVEMWRASYG